MSDGRWLVRSWSRPRGASVVQLAVWLLSIALCVALLAARADGASMAGLARGRIVQLSVPWPSRVEAVPVGLFQSVRGGEVVALLDDSVLQAQIAQIEAEIARLRSEHDETQGLLGADFAEREAGWDAQSRAFARDASELAVRLREVEVDLEYDRALAEGLVAHADALNGLVARGHAPPAELELARAEASATARRVEENEILAGDLRARLAEAETRETRHRTHAPARPPPDAASAQLEQSIAVQRGLLRELEAQRAQHVLRAPFDGIVVAIGRRAGEAALERPGENELRQPGEAVGPGEPIVAVAAGRASEIVAYALDGGRVPEPGSEVEVATTRGTPRIARSRVASVGPAVERLPERLWVNQIPSWGRPLIVPIPSALEVVTGDRVEVWLP